MTIEGAGALKSLQRIENIQTLALKDLMIYNKALLGNYGDSRQRAGFMEGCESRKSIET